MAGRSKNEYEQPWPYDCKVAGLGLMLADPKEGSAWHEEQARFFDQLVALTAEDRSYQQWPPDIEFPYAQVSFIEGAGASEQAQNRSRRRYGYTRYADASSGQVVKTGLVVDQSGISGPVVSAHPFNDALYAASGKKIFKRTSDGSGAAWTQVGADLPAVVSGQMVAFQGTQANPYLFIPQGSGANYVTMSVTEVYVVHASRHARDFETVGDELWLSTVEGNQTVIRKATDGGTAATWGAVTIIGDGLHSITGLRAVNDRLYCLRTNGVSAPSVDAVAVDEDITPDLRDGESDANGAINLAWNNRLVFKYGSSLLAYDTDSGALAPIGPEILEANYSPIKGPVTTVAHHQGICLYATLTDAAGATHLARFGSWEMVSTDRGVQRQFVPAWHMSLYEWAGKTAVKSIITSVYGAPRLYIFFDDGSAAWMRLAVTSNVTDDPNYLFDTAHTGELYLPRWNAGFPFEFKLLKGIGLHGRDLLGGTRTLGVAYKDAASASWIGLGTTGETPGERLSAASGTSGKAFDVKVTLTSTGTSSTPILTACVIYSALRIEGLKVITASLKTGQGVVDHLGRELPNSWQEIKANLEAAMSSAGSITVIAPDGSELQVIGLSYSHDYASRDPRSKSQRWVEGLRMVQSRAVATRGIWKRAEPYRWSDLATLTWADMRQI